MPGLRSLTPYIEVFDMVASLAFYCDELGFEVSFASPEVETAEGRFPHFAQLSRDGLALMLNTAYDSNDRPPARNEPRWSGCRHVALYIECEDVEALYAELTARGLKADAPALTGYGRLAFSVRDPDGYGVTFQAAG